MLNTDCTYTKMKFFSPTPQVPRSSHCFSNRNWQQLYPSCFAWSSVSSVSFFQNRSLFLLTYVHCIVLGQLSVVTNRMQILNNLVKWSPLKRHNINFRLIFQCFCWNVEEWWERQGRRPNSSDECRRGEKWKSNVSCCWDLSEIMSRWFSSGIPFKLKGRESNCEYIVVENIT